jgi:hypothetical protein
VAEGDPEAWLELHEAQAERLAPSGVRAKRASSSDGMSNFGAWFSTSLLRLVFV